MTCSASPRYLTTVIPVSFSANSKSDKGLSAGALSSAGAVLSETSASEAAASDAAPLAGAEDSSPTTPQAVSDAASSAASRMVMARFIASLLLLWCWIVNRSFALP